MGRTREVDPGGVSRRALLSRTAALACLPGVAGCLGGSTETVRVLAAGSLARTFEDHVGPAFRDATGITVHGEYFGTVALLRMVADRTANPDVVVGADATLLRDRLYGKATDWDVAFAANRVGLAYDPETAIGRALADGEPWYEAVRGAEDGTLAIADPDLDPLGYRAVQAFELAEREHDAPGLRDDLLAAAYREPDEPQLLAGVETGARAAAVCYRNMTTDRGLSFHPFPRAYDFAHPDLADHYATATYTTDDGYTAEGRPVLYSASVLDGARHPAAGRRLVDFLASEPALLREAGLTVHDRLPTASGSVPDGIEL